MIDPNVNRPILPMIDGHQPRPGIIRPTGSSAIFPGFGISITGSRPR